MNPTANNDLIAKIDALLPQTQCTKCGYRDMRRSWKSASQAGKDRALDNWTCPSCSWPEADLVEADPLAEAERKPAETPPVSTRR